MLEHVTPVVLTFNEEANVARTLGALSWARDVVVLDSGSADRTREIAASFPNTRVFERHFDNHAAQWSYAVSETGIRTKWILALDADYVITEELRNELASLNPPPEVSGYEVRFVYCVFGRPLRGSLYPSATVLFRAEHSAFRQDGHTQRVEVSGQVRRLDGRILHDDRKSLKQWLVSQDRYMALEVEKLLTSGAALPVADRIRKAVFLAPLLAFFYTLFVKGTVLDGRAGLHYAIQRMAAEAILALKLLEHRLRRVDSPTDPTD